MNICNNFDLESHGCVPVGEGFKYSCEVNRHGECLNPSHNESCAYYCDDADIVFYDEDEFVKAFFDNNPKGYTVDELKNLYNRIPFDMSHQWIKGLVSDEGKRFTVAYKPLEDLPLYINTIKEPFFKLFLKWRLDIGK